MIPDTDKSSRAHLYDLLNQERARATQTERIMQERLDALRARAEAAEARERGLLDRHNLAEAALWRVYYFFVTESVKAGPRYETALDAVCRYLGKGSALATPPPPASREADVTIK